MIISVLKNVSFFPYLESLLNPEELEEWRKQKYGVYLYEVAYVTLL